MPYPIQVGMNGRFFPNNWRPAIDEIQFAREAGFACMQFVGPASGLGEERLGADLETVGSCLHEAGLTAVMEIPINVYSDGRTTDGRSLLDSLRVNLPAIKALNCICVHFHLVLRDKDLSEATARQYEQAIIPQLAAAVKIAQLQGFRFGIEHNEMDFLPFNSPESCARMLTAIPHLGFVWDFNHVAPAHLAGYKALAGYATMLHVSDTLLPATNFHWPLGQGNINFVNYLQTLLKAGFNGSAILEIGGLPKSGGYGQDTDEALIQSRHYLQQSIVQAMTITQSDT